VSTIDNSIKQPDSSVRGTDQAHSNTLPVMDMAARSAIIAERFRGMADDAIATAEALLPPTAAPAEQPPAGPPTRINWNDVIADEDLLRLRREPTDWAPVTYSLSAALGQQVAPRRRYRKQIDFYNIGTNPVTLAATQQDAQSTTSTRYFSLPAAGAMTRNTEGPFFAYSPLGTTLVVIEDYYGDAPLGRAVAHLFALARLRAKGQAQPAGSPPDEHTGQTVP
jgi:hypothetical protein